MIKNLILATLICVTVFIVFMSSCSAAQFADETEEFVEPIIPFETEALELYQIYETPETVEPIYNYSEEPELPEDYGHEYEEEYSEESEEPEYIPFTPLINARELLGIIDPLLPYYSTRLSYDAARLAELYPTALSLYSIGESVLGNEIPLLRLGSGERRILWVGGVHGRELVTGAYLLMIAEYYANAYYGLNDFGRFSADEVRSLLREFTVYIIPIANPDGVDIAIANGDSNVRVDNRATWRNNANGVDLNRNFPFDWEHNSSDTTVSNHLFFRGESAGSEPETIALMELTKSVDFEHLVTVHVAGQVIAWRDNNNGEIPGDRELARTISRVTGYYMRAPTAVARNGWAGGFENWFRYHFNRPGVYIAFAQSGLYHATAANIGRFYNAEMMNWARNRYLVLEVLYDLSVEIIS